MKGIVAGATWWLALLLTTALPSQALDLVPQTIDQLIDRSPRIVIATCTATDTRAVAAHGNNPFTFSRFDKVESLKGDLGGRFELRLFGGRLGNTRIWEDGLPSFTPGTRYLLFLGPSNAEGYPLVKPQGVFEILAAQGEPPAERLRATAGQGHPEQTLAQLRSRVRERTAAMPPSAGPGRHSAAPAGLTPSHPSRDASTAPRGSTTAATRQLPAP